MRRIRVVLNGCSDLTRRGRALKSKPLTCRAETDVDWHQLAKPSFCWKKLDFSKPGSSRSKLGEGSIQAGTRYSVSLTFNINAPSIRQLGDLKTSHRTAVTTAKQTMIVNVRTLIIATDLCGLTVRFGGFVVDSCHQRTPMLCSHCLTCPGHCVVIGLSVGRIPNA